MGPQQTNRLKVDLHGLQTRLMWANERVIEEQNRVLDRTESREETVAWFIEEGGVAVKYARGRATASAGQWLLLRAEQGRQQFKPGSRLISLRFHLRLRGGKPLFARSRDLVFEGEQADQLERAARRLVAEFENVDAPGTLFVARERLSLVDNLRIEAAFMGWLAVYVDAMEAAGEVAEVVGERDPRVGKALRLIEHHRMREKFSETELARECGLSVNQLGRLFRADVDKSPFQYFEIRRLELARHALAESSLPVKEVAFELGFSSPPHFSNWFTDRTGFSPRAWRQARATGGTTGA